MTKSFSLQIFRRKLQTTEKYKIKISYDYKID